MPDTPEPDKILEVLPVAEEPSDAMEDRAALAHKPDGHSGSSQSPAIGFKDFVPKQEGSKPALLGLVQAPVFAELEEALSRANRWIARSGVRVLNVETVFLPNVQETQQSAMITNRGDMMDSWRQFIRVWYLESS
jgi:hypothetical protein